MSERPVSVTVFHNVSRDAHWGFNTVWRSGPVPPEGQRAYQDEKTGTWSWKGRAETPDERHELVRVFEYAASPEDVENDSVLERAFEVFNVGEGPVAQRYRANRLRSLSVGDVLRVTRADDSVEWWSCESCGWAKRNEDVLRVVTAAQGKRLVRERYAPWAKNEPLSVTVPLTGGAYSSRANRPEQAPVTQVAPNVVVVHPAHLGEFLEQVTGWPSFAHQGNVDCDGQSFEGEY